MCIVQAVSVCATELAVNRLQKLTLERFIRRHASRTFVGSFQERMMIYIRLQHIGGTFCSVARVGQPTFRLAGTYASFMLRIYLFITALLVRS